MKPNNTSLGGSQEAFPDTTVGVLRSFAGGPEDLERFCKKYWKPMYAYLRASSAKANEDAKDLTQAFFVWLLEEGSLLRYDPQRGRLRAYLKILLRRFVGHHDVAMNRLKRGGGVQVFSMGDPRAPEMKSPEGAPDELFDRAWVTEIVDAAVERVKARYASAPQPRGFEIYEAYTLGPEPERPAYADLARRFGIHEHQVKQLIFDVRQHIRREIRSELAHLTRNAQELEEEWHELFGR
jgi:DNA-directed RNA polymerase specialized sigma24 family protein